MSRSVAFLRAINVGGHTVRMDRLRLLFESVGLKKVETFIASGNVLFDSSARNLAALEEKLERHLERALGYEVITFVRPLHELVAVRDNHPFTDFGQRGHRLSVGFLKHRLSPEQHRALKRLESELDAFHVDDRHAYWLCRGRTMESKVAGGALEKALGAPVTFRNITTVTRLASKTVR